MNGPNCFFPLLLFLFFCPKFFGLYTKVKPGFFLENGEPVFKNGLIK